VLKLLPERERPDAEKFCQTFLSNAGVPRYVLGRNEYAISVANKIEIDGFVDDFTVEDCFLGKPVIKTKQIPPTSYVVSAVVCGRPIIALKTLMDHNINCLDYFSFVKYSGLKIKKFSLFEKFTEDVKKSWNKYIWIYNRLADRKSKNLMMKLLNFRISLDLIHMEEIPFTQDTQYFDEFLSLQSGEVFVDAGGFDGQTSLDFIKRCPKYQSIHLFDPDPDNLKLAKENLLKQKNIFFYPIGLANKKSILKLKSGEGPSSRISESGDMEVQVDTLDNLINERITFIKMDVEGAEVIALEGAKKHIITDHPKMAICCYHKFDDFWRIPEQVLSIRDDYFVYFRHYTEGTKETVLFFIPK